MKKRLTIVFIIIIMSNLFMYNAFADVKKVNSDFVLRNVIHYGMTIDDVKKAETKNGNPESMATELYISKTEPYSYFNYLDITVAGYSDSNLCYIFNKDDNRINTIVYGIRDHDTLNKSSADTIFVEIYESLINKYGRSNWDNFLNLYYYEGWISPPAFNLFTIDEALSWLVEYNDCYLNVQLFEYHYKDRYYVDVVYVVESKQEVNVLFAEKQYEEQKKQEGRNNDL